LNDESKYAKIKIAMIKMSSIETRKKRVYIRWK